MADSRPHPGGLDPSLIWRKLTLLNLDNPDRRVLHVLPHPGGGGETYVDALGEMRGYVSQKAYVTSRADDIRGVPVGAARAQVRALGFTLLHVHGEVASTLSLPVLAARPSVVTINGLHLVRRLNGWRRRVAESNLRLVIRAASATICVSDSEYEDVVSIAGSRRVTRIDNGVAAPKPVEAQERTRLRAGMGIAPGETVALFVAALDEHKNPIVAARAAESLKASGGNFVLLIAGSGPLREDLEAIERSSGAVRTLGFRSDVESLLAVADVFILPSRREGLSFSLLEAMATGLPVIVSDAPGNVDAVGDAGVVVPTDSVDGFVSAFELLLDPVARRTLGARARDRFARQFTRERMVEQTAAVYDEVLGRHN